MYSPEVDGEFVWKMHRIKMVTGTSIVGQVREAMTAYLRGKEGFVERGEAKLNWQKGEEDEENKRIIAVKRKRHNRQKREWEALKVSMGEKRDE